MAESSELPIPNSVAKDTPEDSPTEVKIPSYSEYEPIFLEKDDLKKVVTLLFDVDPEQFKPQNLADRLSEDKSIVRQKYLLPDEMVKFQHPEEYYHRLEDIAASRGIPIRDKREFAQFFRERLADAVFLIGHGSIALDQLKDTDTPSEVAKKSSDLEHELIHAIQVQNYPRMPLIQMEYEAYIANGNEDIFKTKPWLFIERIALSLTIEQLDELWAEYLREKK